MPTLVGNGRGSSANPSKEWPGLFCQPKRKWMGLPCQSKGEWTGLLCQPKLEWTGSLPTQAGNSCPTLPTQSRMDRPLLPIQARMDGALLPTQEGNGRSYRKVSTPDCPNLYSKYLRHSSPGTLLYPVAMLVILVPLIKEFLQGLHQH